MYRIYAHVQQARLNLGIRRRLAPLLGNDRKRIELLNAPAVVAARHAGDLLRRRNRHGRQYLSRRPQRRPHADAMEFRQATRVFRGPIRKASTCRSFTIPNTITKRTTWKGSCTIRTRCSGGCGGCWRCANAGARSAKANVNFSRSKTGKSCATSCGTRRKSFWSWPTFRASCSRSNSTSPRSRAACRSSCSAGWNFRSSPTSPIFSRLLLMPSFGSRWS